MNKIWCVLLVIFSGFHVLVFCAEEKTSDKATTVKSYVGDHDGVVEADGTVRFIEDDPDKLEILQRMPRMTHEERKIFIETGTLPTRKHMRTQSH